jgi:uncharacterized protein (TIGR02145 family)
MAMYPRIHGLFTSNEIGDASNIEKFGLLYNKFSVDKQIAPLNWHVVTMDELEILKKNVLNDGNWGVIGYGGQKLKETDYFNWINDGTHIGTNTIGFSAKGGNYRLKTGVFYDSDNHITGVTARWWCSGNDGLDTSEFQVYYNNNILDRVHTAIANNRRFGNSIRCVSDDPWYPNRQVRDKDGNYYSTTYINGQEWITKNLATTTYADGTPITNYLADSEDLSYGCVWVNPVYDSFNTFSSSGLDVSAASNQFGYLLSNCYLETTTPTTPPVKLRITCTLEMFNYTTPPRLVVLDEDSVEWYNQQLTNYNNIILIPVEDSVGKFTLFLYNTDETLYDGLYYTNFSLTNLFIENLNGWVTDTSGAYCWYNNNISNKSIYGALYNWYAVNNVSDITYLEHNSTRETGWRVATKEDYTNLRSYLDTTNAGGKLKEVGTTHWASPNNGATDQYGFTALPGGYRGIDGVFTDLYSQSFWWTSTEYDASNSWYLDIHNDQTRMDIPTYLKRSGYSVRLVRDTYPNITFPQMEDYDGNKYDTVLIGEHLWTKSNLRVKHYRNGDEIHYIGNKKDWFLPSKDELYLMYSKLKYYGRGNFTNNKYWSSTEASSTQAYVINFTTGAAEIVSKSSKTGINIRPVRIFNSSISYDVGSYGFFNGYIFHKSINSDGTYEYYECYIEDTFAGTVGWSNITSVECGDTLPYIGTGIANTYLITHQAGHSSSAANKCETEDENYRWSQDSNGANCTYDDDMSIDMRNLPKVTTKNVTSVSYYSFNTGGHVVSSGNYAITARGICFNFTGRPKIDNGTVINVSGTIGYFTNNLNGMDSGKTYYIRAFATNSYGTMYGNEVMCTTLSMTIPTITTGTPFDISETTMRVTCFNIDDGGSVITSKGVCWSTSQNPTIANNININGTGDSNFVSNIAGLLTNVTYYIRAYATNSVGTGYGNQVTATTRFLTIPSLTTSTITNLLETTATSGGQGINDGGLTITEKGVCINTTSNPTILDTKFVSTYTGDNNFTRDISDLIKDTTYHVRAYATNSLGTGYGSDIEFKTQRPSFGYLYNYYVINEGKSLISASYGYEIPSYDDWQALRLFVGGTNNGYKLMEVSKHPWFPVYWDLSELQSGNLPPDNYYGFSAVGGGVIDGYGNPCSDINELGLYWTSSNPLLNNPWVFRFKISNTNIEPTNNYHPLQGLSIRFKRINLTNYVPNETVIDYDGNVYSTIRIGDQVWTTQNLKTTHFMDGTEITRKSQYDFYQIGTKPYFGVYNDNEDNK